MPLDVRLSSRGAKGAETEDRGLPRNAPHADTRGISALSDAGISDALGAQCRAGGGARADEQGIRRADRGATALRRGAGKPREFAFGLHPRGRHDHAFGRQRRTHRIR